MLKGSTLKVPRPRKMLQEGQIFGELTIIRETSKQNYLCRCSCGNEPTVYKWSLTTGGTTSCGCEFSRIQRELHTTHGKSHSPLYKVWAGMKRRCSNPNERSYPRYGGRGIKVCKRWLHNFENFSSDMLGGYSAGLQLDRIDNNGNYTPENCRWSTNTEQTRNKSSNIWITFNDVTLCLSDWARRLGIKVATLHRRYQVGWRDEKLLLTPVHPSNAGKRNT